MPTWVMVIFSIVGAVAILWFLYRILQYISYCKAIGVCKKQSGLAVVQNPDTRLWEATRPPDKFDDRYRRPGILASVAGADGSYVIETYRINSAVF